MQNENTYRAGQVLKKLGGRALARFELAEYQRRIILGPWVEIIVSSPWRVLIDGVLVLGSGDVEGGEGQPPQLETMKGLRLLSARVDDRWQSTLSFEQGHVLEIIPDSAKYESWEAHLETEYAVFSGGQLSLFPPVPRAHPSH